MRQINNWTKEQIAECRGLIDEHKSDGIMFISELITKEDSPYKALHKKYWNTWSSEEATMLQDITDLINGDAEFREDKYVFLLNGIKPADNARYALTRNNQTGKADFCFYVLTDLTYSWLQFTEHEAKQLISQAGLHYDDFEKIEVPADD